MQTGLPFLDVTPQLITKTQTSAAFSFEYWTEAFGGNGPVIAYDIVVSIVKSILIKSGENVILMFFVTKGYTSMSKKNILSKLL